MKGPSNGELSYNSLKDGGDRSVLTDDSYNETESYHTENWERLRWQKKKVVV